MLARRAYRSLPKVDCAMMACGTCGPIVRPGQVCTMNVFDTFAEICLGSGAASFIAGLPRKAIPGHGQAHENLHFILLDVFLGLSEPQKNAGLVKLSRYPEIQDSGSLEKRSGETARSIGQQEGQALDRQERSFEGLGATHMQIWHVVRM